jgi:hypothetical protein
LRTRWWILVASGLVGAALIFAIASVSLRPPAAGEVVAAFDAPSEPGDPAYPHGVDLGLDAETARYAGAADGRRFWIGRDGTGRVCLAVIIERAELGGATCGSVTILRDRGLTIGLDGSRQSLVAHLVPDDVDVDAAPAPWRVVGDNVLVAERADLDGDGTLVLPREGHGSIRLQL